MMTRQHLADLESLAPEHYKLEPEVRKMAFETRLRQFWREHVLGRYLRGRLTRQQTVEEVGIEWVELAERQHAAMTEDLAWAENDQPRSSTPPSDSPR
jgi:hypothetical protein